VLLLAARAWRPLRSLYEGVRRDWTRLSFGLFVSAGILFGLIEHEEDPALTVFVFLPSLIVLLGAFAYLRSATKAQRILAMLISLALAIGVRAAGGKLFYGGYGAVLGAIIFIPALLELLPSTGQSQAEPSRTIAS
jgi:lipoprotein signal peptidase